MLLSLSLKMRLFAWCFCILHSLKLSNAWDFTNLGIKNDNTSVVQHISVYYARAFICLTHSKNHNRPQRATATLVEASWPENMIGVKPVIFPNEDYFVRRAAKCKGIKQAVVSWCVIVFWMSTNATAKFLELNNNKILKLSVHRPQISTAAVDFGY